MLSPFFIHLDEPQAHRRSLTVAAHVETVAALGAAPETSGCLDPPILGLPHCFLHLLHSVSEFHSG
jgi:hypothetical protein